MYVILSVGEISHDLSDKVYAPSVLRWDSSLSFRMTYQKSTVILSVSEISHDLSDKVYAPSVLRWDSSLLL